jgi:hypothetical protein
MAECVVCVGAFCVCVKQTKERKNIFATDSDIDSDDDFEIIENESITCPELGGDADELVCKFTCGSCDGCTNALHHCTCFSVQQDFNLNACPFCWASINECHCLFEDDENG